MRIVLVIKDSELEIKKAIAMGWNKRFDEELTHKDIAEVSNKEDILSAIPYLDADKIEVKGIN